MASSTPAITADGLTGIILAFEGVRKAMTLLNGPTGCKFYHSAISDAQLIRQADFDPLNHPARWYFGQPRVPCTYLDTGDYVYGSADKLLAALEFLRDHELADLIAVVDSPGAALIGDDLVGLVSQIMGDRTVVCMETPGFSTTMAAGHEAAAIALLELLTPASPARSSCGDLRVNLLGMPIYARNHTGDVAELRRLLGLCGIEVNCVLCGGSSVADVRRIREAALNVVVHPEFGLRQAEWLHDRCGMATYALVGPPIGFNATEAFIRDLCMRLSANSGSAIEDIDRGRARAYAFISRVHSISGLPRGVPFTVEGSWGDLGSYLDFLVDYLGMVPECLIVCDPEEDAGKKRVISRLETLGLKSVLERDPEDASSELVLGSGNLIARLRLADRRFTGIETMLPSLGYYDVVPKTHLGVRGALQLSELVLNGLAY